MSRTVEQIHEANNAVIAAAKAAAELHNVDMVIAVGGCVGDTYCLGADGSGSNMVALSASAAGCMLRVAGATSSDVYTQWFRNGIRNFDSMLARDKVEPVKQEPLPIEGEP